LHKAAFLYLATEDEAPHKIEVEPGLNCFLEDISDTGYAVIVGGKADSGIRVKVQFALDNAAVCMSGIVRSISYREETNRSILHIEADTLPLGTRNRILGEVFGMQADEDADELPFRILDDEAARMGDTRGVPESILSFSNQSDAASNPAEEVFDASMLDVDDIF
jgi:hypothetical protein